MVHAYRPGKGGGGGCWLGLVKKKEKFGKVDF